MRVQYFVRVQAQLLPRHESALLGEEAQLGRVQRVRGGDAYAAPVLPTVVGWVQAVHHEVPLEGVVGVGDHQEVLALAALHQV